MSYFNNNKGDLKINRGDKELSGEYTCHAKNIAGEAMMKINLEVISGKKKKEKMEKIDKRKNYDQIMVIT